MAVLLVYGRPDVVPTEERMCYDNLSYSQGTMGILFRPGDGKSIRVHFNRWDQDGIQGFASSARQIREGSIRIMLGEVGEYGPLANEVVVGYATVSGSS